MYNQESQLAPTTSMPGGENAAPACRLLQTPGQAASPANMVESKDKCGTHQQSPMGVRVGAMLDGNPSNTQPTLVGYNQSQLANDSHTPRSVETQASCTDSGSTQSVIGQNHSSDNVHPLSNEPGANEGGFLHPTTSPPTSKEQASTVVTPAGIENQDSHNNEHQPVSFLPHMTSPLHHPPVPFDTKSVAHGKHWDGNGTVHPAFNAEKQMCHDHGASHRRHAVLPTNSAQCQGDYTENYCNRPEYTYNVPSYNTDSYNGHSNDQGYNSYQNYGPQEAGYMQWESLNHYGERHNMCMYGPPNPYGMRLCNTPQGHRDHVYKPDTYQDNYSDSLSSPSPDRASFSSSNEHVGFPHGNLMYGFADNHHYSTQKKSKRKRNKTKRGCDISGLSGIKAQMDETVILQLPSEPPKSIPEAVCMYIDYLIAENEAKTEISKADTPDYLDVDYTEEDYLQEVLHKHVEFPTTKFQEWLRLYNFEVQVCGTPKKKRPSSNEDFSQTNQYAKMATTMNISQVDKAKPATKGAIDIHITRPIYPELTSEDSKAVQSLIANTLTHTNQSPVSSEKVQNVQDNQSDRTVRSFHGEGPTKTMSMVQQPKLPGFQSTFGSWEAGCKTDNIEGLSARKTSNISKGERKSLHDDQILIKLAEEAGINLATPEIKSKSPDMQANCADTLLTNSQDASAKSGNPSAFPENTWTRVNFDPVKGRASEPGSDKPVTTTITPVTERQTVSGHGTKCKFEQEGPVSGRDASSVTAQQKVDVEQKHHEVTGNSTGEAASSSSRGAPVAVSHTNETTINEIDPEKEHTDEGTNSERNAAAKKNMSMDTDVSEGVSANKAENTSKDLVKRGTEVEQGIQSDRFEPTKSESKLVTVGESKCIDSEPVKPVTENQRSTSPRSRETTVSASKRGYSLEHNVKGAEDIDSTPEKKLRRN